MNVILDIKCVGYYLKVRDLKSMLVIWDFKAWLFSTLHVFYVLCKFFLPTIWYCFTFYVVGLNSYLLQVSRVFNHHKSFLKFFAILKVQVITLDLLATSVMYLCIYVLARFAFCLFCCGGCSWFSWFWDRAFL